MLSKGILVLRVLVLEIVLKSGNQLQPALDTVSIQRPVLGTWSDNMKALMTMYQLLKDLDWALLRRTILLP